MATTRLKLQTKASLASELATLKQRVVALERHRDDKEAVEALARAHSRAKHDERERERVRQRLEAEARKARWKAIDDFNRQFWDARLPDASALRQEKLRELNAYLIVRGMEPEPME